MLQHIVPQVYLKQFAEKNAKNYMFYAYDKDQKQYWHVNVKKVAARNDFYKLSGIDNEIAWEETLSKIEQQLRQLLVSIRMKCESCLINNEAVVLDNYDKCRLLFQMIVQIYRGIAASSYEKAVRNEIRLRLRDEINNLAKEYFENEDSIDVDKVLDNDNIWRLAYAKQMIEVNNHKSLLLKLFNRKWIVFRSFNSSFITSDEPIIFYNSIIDEVGEFKAGLGNDTIVFYPLSYRILIGLYPQDYLFGITEKYNNKIIILPENDSFVDKVNLLQLRQCNKQIYSRDEKTIEKLIDKIKQ